MLSVTYANFSKVVECIRKTAGHHSISDGVVAYIIDYDYPGVFVAYHYWRTYTPQWCKISGDTLIFLSPEGKETTTKNVSEELNFAHHCYESLSVNVTGARPGEILKGFRSGAKGATVKLVSGIVPPCSEDIVGMMLDRLRWKRFLSKLNTLPFFADMQEFERGLWLVAHQRSGEYDFADIKGLRLSVLEAGESAFSQKLDDETLSNVLSKEWNALELRNQFPRKPGTKEGHRNVLTFFPRYWNVAVAAQRKSWKGMLMTDLKTFWVGDGEGLVIENFGPTKISFGVLVPETGDVNFEEITRRTLGTFWEKFQKVTASFTPATFKSLMQKLIRASPLTVSILGKEYDGKVVVQACFASLFMHPGSFVPDIQRFVSGRESAIKRLMISIIEDSWAPDEVILELAILSTFTQRFPETDLQSTIFQKLLRYVVQAFESPNFFNHSYFSGPKPELKPFVMSTNLTPLEMSSAILDDVRSFGSDLMMTRALARYPSFSKSKPKRLTSWPISKAFDQHTSPEIAYLFSLELLEKYYDAGSATRPFANFFHELFLQVSGVNARKPTTGLSGHIPKNDPQLREEAARAQEMMFQIYLNTLPVYRSDAAFKLTGKLGVEWISGLVGVIEVRGSPPAIASLRPEDPYQIVALAKPSRGRKDARLSDERIEQVIEDARKVLNSGVKLNSATPPIKSLENKIMVLAKIQNEEFPTFVFAESKAEIAKGNYLLWDEISSYVIVSSCDTSKVKFPEDPKVKRRLLTYFSFASEIEVTRLSKDGGGTELFASLLDAEVLKWLLNFSQHHPDVLERVPKSLTKYKIKNPPVIWELKRQLVQEFSSSKASSLTTLSPTKSWKPISDSSGRVPKSYQIESAEEMLAKKTKGNFLWLSVGLGKTMIVMMYLQKAIERREIPSFIVYTLPKSAIESVIKEIDSFGINVNVCIPIQAWKKNQHASRAKSHNSLLPFHVNVIEHDHLRKMENILVEKAPETFLIVDEVHKTFGETKRTSVALELARLSFNFIVLSGTVVTDTNLYQLIWWLQQILPYEVNEKNFWSAINGMVSKKSTTGINVERHFVEAEMLPVELIAYEKLVPPALGGRNSKPLTSDFNKAFELCYDVSTRKMVELALEISQHTPVMLVVRNYEHQKKVAEALKNRKVLLIGPTSVNVTDDLVEAGKAKPFDVAIVPQSFSTGYTLTYAKAQITGVYPSNQANREQIEGRINRVTQRSKTINYYVVSCGILDHVLEKHNSAANLSSALSQIQKEVGSGF